VAGSGQATPADGVHAMLPRARMSEGARRLRAAYERVPGAPLYRREFYIWDEALDLWKGAQGMPADVPQEELFLFDPPGNLNLGRLGWCEAELLPCFETKVLETRGEHELVQDCTGRTLLCFTGRRHGFMPEYVDHPVKDMKSWVEGVKWRMDPKSPERYADLDARMAEAARAAGEGRIITQNLIGGYMYLRSLIGPEQLLYAFYDMPDVVHDCMRGWFELADAVIASHQRSVTIDEIYLAEDICYNHGALISPEMMGEFIIPYYQRLIANLKARQLDPDRHLYVQIDTDGHAVPVIDIYRKGIGMDVMSPFEVASGCDVVEIGRAWPDLAMGGGIDKRVLAAGKKAIDAMLERIIPVMRKRGGYIPMCDHGVPVNVAYEDYLHYRRRLAELGG
jgi:hypothetical protein